DEAAELEFGAAGVISLFNPCFAPCSFPVRSLLQIGSFREEKPENADGIEVLYALVGHSVGIFPVFFPVNGNFRQRQVH
ncbi:MAG: hypothetical protein ACXVK3_15865, partial [Candidatus Angelobacter sp.]